MSVKSVLDDARLELKGTSVDFGAFLANLAKFFGYDNPDSITVNDLSILKFEDLEELGIPKGKAKVLALKVFRNACDTAKPEPQVVQIDMTNNPEQHAQMLTPVQCVERYDPDNATNPYGMRIKEAVENQHCLAFKCTGEFDPEMTKVLVQEILDGYPEREEVTIDDIPGLKVYRVGDRPGKFVDENPAKPGMPLRSGDAFYCADKLVQPGIPLDIKQLVYLAVLQPSKGGSGEATNLGEMDIYEKVVGRSFNEVAKRWKKAAAIFHDRKATNTLPQLRLRLKGPKSDKPNDPFETSRHVRT